MKSRETSTGKLTNFYRNGVDCLFTSSYFISANYNLAKSAADEKNCELAVSKCSLASCCSCLAGLCCLVCSLSTTITYPIAAVFDCGKFVADCISCAANDEDSFDLLEANSHMSDYGSISISISPR